jgi:serine/threonine protein kinase
LTQAFAGSFPDPSETNMPDSALGMTPDAAPSEPARITTTFDGSPAQPEQFPRPFGRYELRSLLGRGGMGAVYLAHDPQLDRLVALKVPRPLGDEAGEWRQRFQGEARAAATLQHPNICPVFEVGAVESQPYLTMAFIEGESLAARLKRTKSMPVRAAVALVRTLAGAVNEAHERGIIHRDLKPGNVMIDRRGQPIVMDFGLALRSAVGDDLRLTLSGVAMGTPAYMPPEQAGGDHAAIGPPTDVYALGVILYELVTGRVPFQARTFGKLVAQIERDSPPLPSGLNPDVDPALEAIILTALEKESRHRFSSAAALVAALDAYERGERDSLLTKHGVSVERASRLTEPYLPAARPQALGPASQPAARRLRPALVVALTLGFVLLALLGVVFFVQTAKRPDRNPDDPNKGPPTVVDTPKKDPPKPVAYPAASTLIELPCWHVLTDATQEQTQKWLDERKTARHSVLWLDATQVGDRPLFCAVAALDERQPDWTAMLDERASDVQALAVLRKKINTEMNWIASISAYTGGDDDVRSVVLWQLGGKRWGMSTNEVEGVLDSTIADLSAKGVPLRLLRPFSAGEKRPRYAVYHEAVVRGSPTYKYGLSAEKLSQYLDEQRKNDFLPVTVSAVAHDNNLERSAVCEPNRSKLEWEVSYGLTAAEMKTKAVALAAQRFRPRCVTAYAWDGAVRYYVVWVKEPAPGK